MNKRAKTRLIGVTAIILIAIGAIVFGAGSGDGAYYKSVEEIATDPELIGERVRVGGAVVDGSWDKRSNPMTFQIRMEDDTNGVGPALNVVYNGNVPSTFGDGVVAILTGELQPDGTIISEDMITKCPSKYESATGALGVTEITGDKAAEIVGKSIKVTGYVVPGTIAPPGGSTRLELSSEPGGGGVKVPVFYEGALPEGMTDDSQIVLGGMLDADGVFDALSIAMAGTES